MYVHMLLCKRIHTSPMYIAVITMVILHCAYIIITMVTHCILSCKQIHHHGNSVCILLCKHMHHRGNTVCLYYCANTYISVERYWHFIHSTDILISYIIAIYVTISLRYELRKRTFSTQMNFLVHVCLWLQLTCLDVYLSTQVFILQRIN